MPNEALKLDRRGPVVWLTLNRPAGKGSRS